MAPTLRQVVAKEPLRVLAGGDLLERPVRWVAVSELEDPTPFLEGGELVLTTGMRLGAGDAEPYISRLVALGAAGLGFGVGLGHDEVPETFTRAAAALRLPLLEVPRDTPFIAIGKAVSELLAAERHDELTRALAAQGRLTRAALATDANRAVLDRLATETGGWAVLFDTSGETVAAAGPGALRRAGELTPELDRLRGGRAPASVAIATPEEHVIVQPLGRPRRPHGFFAVGASRPFSPVAHTVVNLAAALLTLALEQDDRRHDALVASHARVRAAALRLLVAGEAAAAGEVLGHEPPRAPYVVLACRGGDPVALSEALPGLAAPWPLSRGTTGDTVGDTVGDTAAGTAGDGTGAAAGDKSGDEAGEAAGAAAGDNGTGTRAGTGRDAGRLVVAVVAEPDAERAIAIASGHGPVGVSAPLPAGEAATGVEQALRALASAAPVMRFPDLAGQGLLSLLDRDEATAWARALLAPLRDQGERGRRGDLVTSLRAYLACNGHWDAAAHRLGVHRHTLRYRVRKITERLGRDLDDPATRAELWAAIEIDAGGVSSW